MLIGRCGVCYAQLYEVESAVHLPNRVIWCRNCKTKHVRRGTEYMAEPEITEPVEYRVAEGEATAQVKGEVTTPFPSATAARDMRRSRREALEAERASQARVAATAEKEEVKKTTTTKKKSSSRTRRR